jgi:hypothetical protein
MTGCLKNKTKGLNQQAIPTAESYNGNGSSDSKGFEQYINKFKESMNAALKSNHCPEQ